MSRKAVHALVIAVALVGIFTLSATARGERGDQCLFNDDCTSPLVCEARRCRVQCRSDRDCSAGSRCVVDTASPARNQCALIPAAPPANGFIVGRVDASPGVPLSRCTVDLGRGDTLHGDCDARGEFIIANVPPGRYDVRIRPAITDGLQRVVVAYVDAGVHASVGTVTLSPQRLDSGNVNAPAPGAIGIAPVIVPLPKGMPTPMPLPKK